MDFQNSSAEMIWRYICLGEPLVSTLDYNVIVNQPLFYDGKPLLHAFIAYSAQLTSDAHLLTTYMTWAFREICERMNADVNQIWDGITPLERVVMQNQGPLWEYPDLFWDIICMPTTLSRDVVWTCASTFARRLDVKLLELFGRKFTDDIISSGIKNLLPEAFRSASTIDENIHWVAEQLKETVKMLLGPLYQQAAGATGAENNYTAMDYLIPFLSNKPGWDEYIRDLIQLLTVHDPYILGQRDPFQQQIPIERYMRSSSSGDTDASIRIALRPCFSRSQPIDRANAIKTKTGQRG